MWIIITEILICLIIALIFGLIVGWKLAKNSKLKEYEILSEKYLQAEKEIKELKGELIKCKTLI